MLRCVEIGISQTFQEQIPSGLSERQRLTCVILYDMRPFRGCAVSQFTDFGLSRSHDIP